MMKRWCFLLLLAAPLIVAAQGIRYDTIRVAPSDERNIHTPQEQQSPSVQHVHRSQNQQRQTNVEKASGTRFERSKLRLGANLGLSISRNYTNVGFGPQVGYQFNDYFMAGAGVKYYYTKANYTDYEIKNNLFGGNLFGYFYPVRYFVLFLQPEINYTRSTLTYNEGDQFVSKGFAPSLVAGAGLRLGFTHLTLNYDLVQHSRSPHPSGFYMGVSAFF